MLRLAGPQVESLWDEVLPSEVRELPEDLAKIDELLSDPTMLEPIAAHWQREEIEAGRDLRGNGRPTIAMSTYLRMMVIKQRSGWGYETLAKEVSDSLHLRRFCAIPLDGQLPHESTIRKLTRRLGPETVNELTRVLIAKAAHERRFRPRAARIDSTVIEADVRYPSDAILALQGARSLAREGRRLGDLIGAGATRVRDRSRAIGRRVRKISRTAGRRSGEARKQVIELNRQAGELLRRSAAQARKLATAARAKARGRGAQAKLRAAAQISRLAERCEQVAEQTLRRAKGLKITDRIVSLADPEARPIRKGKAGKPTEFGYVAQICELTPSTKPGSRGLITPAATAAGNPGENTLLPQTVAEIEALALEPKEVALDGGFGHHKSEQQLESLGLERLSVAGRRESGSATTKRRLRRYRTGVEGRISHLKRGYGMGRARLKGDQGQRIWTGWGILAYNLDTLSIWDG